MKQKNTTLLLVDDDQDARLLLRLAFEALSATYCIQELNSGDDALAYLTGEGKYADRTKFPFPGYIITDLNMWAGDGFKILDYIKCHPALSVIPIVMLSSSDDADDVRTAYFLGASSYFIKPRSQQALQALVKKIHDYWMECEVPEVDESGFALQTQSAGKPGAIYPKPNRDPKQSKPA
jgi:CheY-like chemotaxis protein